MAHLLLVCQQMSHHQIPTLVENDIWLKDQTNAIQARIDRFQEKLGSIEQSHGSLYQYAGAHLELGIHYHASEDQWQIREWAS